MQFTPNQAGYSLACRFLGHLQKEYPQKTIDVLAYPGKLPESITQAIANAAETHNSHNHKPKKSWDQYAIQVYVKKNEITEERLTEILNTFCKAVYDEKQHPITSKYPPFESDTPIPPPTVKEKNPILPLNPTLQIAERDQYCVVFTHSPENCETPFILQQIEETPQASSPSDKTTEPPQTKVQIVLSVLLTIFSAPFVLLFRIVKFFWDFTLGPIWNFLSK